MNSIAIYEWIDEIGFSAHLNRHENDELPILFGRIRILIVSVDNEYAKFSRLINCFAVVRIADMITVNDCSLCNFWDAMSIALNNIQFLMPFFSSSSRRIIACVFSSLNRNHLEDNSLHDSLDEVNSLHAFWWCRQKRWAPCSLRKFSSLISIGAAGNVQEHLSILVDTLTR